MSGVKRIIAGLAAVVLLAVIIPQSAYASQTDNAYTYNSYGEAVTSPSVYKAKLIVDGIGLGIGVLNNPQDIYVDDQDNVYILDSGNGRVVILDQEYQMVRELNEFSYKGEALTLGAHASGIFYRDSRGVLYIADTDNNRILMCNLEGEVARVYENPVSPMLDETVAFAPKKIVVDNLGIMYVVSGNINTGALMIDEENEFLGFYGTNEIKASFKVLLEYTWRKFLTEEQQNFLVESFQPVQFNNIFWSEKRFVYVVSPDNEELESPVGRLNVLGKNTFPDDAVFGDELEKIEAGSRLFADITVNDDEYFALLEQKSGKVYYYDEACNLIAAFGGIGNQKGLFKTPVAIETNTSKELMVLDSEKATLTVMELTYYGALISEAATLHNQGLYTQAQEKWHEVLMLNADSKLAYVGLGKACMNQKDYKQAISYFKLAGDQENYSKAKGKIRENWVIDHFEMIAIALGTAVLFILFFEAIQKFFADQFFKRRKGREKV